MSISTTSAQARLKDAHRVLLATCQRAREQWADEASAKFMAEVIDPLEGRVRQTMLAMGEFGETLGAAQRDLREDSQEEDRA
jgi:hypothetical protein